MRIEVVRLWLTDQLSALTHTTTTPQQPLIRISAVEGDAGVTSVRDARADQQGGYWVLATASNGPFPGAVPPLGSSPHIHASDPAL
jgi:hypothetical protein